VTSYTSGVSKIRDILYILYLTISIFLKILRNSIKKLQFIEYGLSDFRVDMGVRIGWSGH